jgi:hypothetical protein
MKKQKDITIWEISMGKKLSRSVSLTDEEWQWLMDEADKNDRSVSWVVRELIRIRQEKEAS